MRSDLQMGKGKLAAQASHASLEAYKRALAKDEDVVLQWEASGCAKVVVKVESEKALVELFEKAKREVPASLIRDAGRTQLEPGTLTCVGLGPWHEIELNKFTGKLKLL